MSKLFGNAQSLCNVGLNQALVIVIAVTGREGGEVRKRHVRAHGPVHMSKGNHVFNTMNDRVTLPKKSNLFTRRSQHSLT